MPHTFPAAGRTWLVTINVGACALVRGLTDCDLYALFDDDGRGLSALLSDPPALCTVVWHLVSDERGQAPPAQEEFARAIDGDALSAMADAFCEALVDFFPPRTRGPRRKLMAKTRAMGAELLARAERDLDRIDPAAAAEELARSLRRGSAPPGGSPAASASTPAP